MGRLIGRMERSGGKKKCSGNQENQGDFGSKPEAKASKDVPERVRTGAPKAATKEEEIPREETLEDTASQNVLKQKTAFQGQREDSGLGLGSTKPTLTQMFNGLSKQNRRRIMKSRDTETHMCT